jgi:hypothetical protein
LDVNTYLRKIKAKQSKRPQSKNKLWYKNVARFFVISLIWENFQDDELSIAESSVNGEEEEEEDDDDEDRYLSGVNVIKLFTVVSYEFS